MLSSLIFLFLGAIVSAIITLMVTRPKQLRKALNDWASLISRRTRPRFIEDKSHPSLTDAFDLASIGDIYVDYAFFQTTSLSSERRPLGMERFVMHYKPIQRPYPPTISRDLFRNFITEKRSEAERKGKTFDNNGSYCLRMIAVERLENIETGIRENMYHLHFEDTDYEHFIFPNNHLEEKIQHPDTGRIVSLRELTGLFRNLVRIDNFPDLPYHFKVGVDSMVITADDYAVFSIRSKRQLIASDSHDGILPIHMSTAEGMYRAVSTPAGSDIIGELPNPFATLARSLHAEINLSIGQHFSFDDLRCVAIVTDKLRAQPVFIMSVRPPRLYAQELLAKWEECPIDVHENIGLILLRWTPEDVCELYSRPILSQIEFKCAKKDEEFLVGSAKNLAVQLASNHAEAGVLLNLICDYPLERIEHCLESNRS